MNHYPLSEKIIERSFFIAVWLIEQLSTTPPVEAQVAALEQLPEGSLGKEIARCLRANNLRLVPHFESHDLKHTLLDFKMTPLDEIRMQAFMLGNGNWTLPSLLIFLYGAVLLPNKWRLLATDFQEGRRALPIKDWTLEEFAAQPLAELRALVFAPRPKQALDLYRLSQYGSFITIGAGIFGMLFCFPFLWSSNLADLVGAGFPFVAGAIFVIGGLINLSLLARARPVVVATT